MLFFFVIFLGESALGTLLLRVQYRLVLIDQSFTLILFVNVERSLAELFAGSWRAARLLSASIRQERRTIVCMRGSHRYSYVVPGV